MDNENQSLNRREFMTCTMQAAAAIAFTGLLTGCKKEGLETLLQKHFNQLSPEELQRVLRRLENEHKQKFAKDTTVDATPAMKDVLFGYGLDISRCIGCRRCVHACVKENNQSRNPEIQWIRVIEFPKEVGIDFAEANPYYCNSPMDATGATPSGLNKRGKEILENQITQYPLYQVDREEGKDRGCTVPRPEHFYVPISCQQCKKPPCVKACPTRATWMEPDGIVVVDYNWCIGCRYCMVACPYGARHFNWKEPELSAEDFNPKTHYLGNRNRSNGVVEKCTFCIQRTRKGLYPVCVEVCPVGARKFGNLLDPKSEIRYIMERKRVLILKNELSTHPKFFYFYGA